MNKSWSGNLKRGLMLVGLAAVVILSISGNALEAASLDEICNDPQFSTVPEKERLAIRQKFDREITPRRIIEDAVSEYQTGNPDKQVRALLQLRLLMVDAMTREGKKGTAHAAIKSCFFSQCSLFRFISKLNEGGKLSPIMRQEARELAESVLTPQERGPNNRAAHYALGNIYAAKVFPESPRAKEWRAYAEAVWGDWETPGDTYEPSYIAHNVGQAVELGMLLGREKELKGEKFRHMFERLRDHISPSGLAVSPGDGAPYDQGSYVTALQMVAKVWPDPTIISALKRAYLAGTAETGRRPEEDFAKAFPDYAKLPATPAALGSQIQQLSPMLWESPDRLILKPPTKDNSSFAAFWIQDDCNYLYHGGISDTRGSLYHYEHDGILLMGARGRYEWPGWNNSFVVSEPDAEFPFRRTDGLHAGIWYHGSANLRVVRAYTPSANYPKIKNDIPAHFALGDLKNPLGYMWGNPEGRAGKLDDFHLQEVEFQFALLPPGGEKECGKVFPGRTWWGGYEYRNVCPSDKPVEILISDLAIAGSAGEKILLPLEKLSDQISFKFIAPDNKEEFREEELPKDAVKKANDKATGKAVLSITTRYGRTVMRIKTNARFDLTKDFNRIELSYCYQTPIRNWTRTPIFIGINGSAVQSNLKLDQQQGGILEDAKAEDRGADSYGVTSYRSIWTHDSKWTRQMLLTGKEGILVVLDTFTPGARANGMLAGPVWHLPSPPECGPASGETPLWFDSNLEHRPPEVRAFTGKYGEKNKNLFISFAAAPGRINGTQYQPKHWNADDYAVFSSTRLAGGEKEYFLTVMIPHDAKLSPQAIGNSRDGLKIQNPEPGTYEISINIRNAIWPYKALKLKISNSGDWSVTR